jgi:hypothetical protein
MVRRMVITAAGDVGIIGDSRPRGVARVAVSVIASAHQGAGEDQSYEI